MPPSEPMTPEQYRQQWIERWLDCQRDRLQMLAFWDRSAPVFVLRPLDPGGVTVGKYWRIRFSLNEMCVYQWDETALIFPGTRAAVAKVLRELADEIDAAPTVEVTP